MKKLLVIIIFVLSAQVCNAEFSVEKIDPIKITATVPAHGKITAVLDTKRTFHTKVSGEYYQGLYKYRGQEYPVAASKINGIFELVFSGKTTGSRQTRRRLYRLKTTQDPNKVKIHSIPASAHANLPCASTTTHKGHVHSTATSTIQQQPVETYRVITISTFADPEYAAIHGTFTNARIVANINTAEALYEKQLNIRFDIVSQDIFSSSTPNMDSRVVLNEFRQLPVVKTSPGVVKYLFSGQVFAGNVVGLAYVGAICYAPDYSAGLVRHYGDLTPLIFAHEMGHTLSAPHDTSMYNNVMFPYISGDLSGAYFTSNTINTIELFLSKFNSCILYKNFPPSIENSRLTIVRKKNSIIITLLSIKNTPIQNVKLSVKINKSKFFAKTNISGKVIKTLRLPKRTRVVASAFVVKHPKVVSKIRFNM